MASNSEIREQSFDPIAVMIIFGALILGAYFLWSFLWGRYEEIIKDSVLFVAHHLRHAHLILYPVLSESYRGVLDNMPNLYSEHLGTNYETVFLKEVFLTIALRNVALVIAALALPFGIYLIIGHERIAFTRRLNVDELIEIHRRYYPSIRPATNNNLLLRDPRFDNWASALDPIDLAIHSANIKLVDPKTIESPSLRHKVENGVSDLKHAQLKNPDDYTKNCEPLTLKQYGMFNWPTSVVQAKSDALTNLFDNIDSYHGLITFDRERTADYYLASLGPRCRYRKGFIDTRHLPPMERALWVLFLACVAQEEKLRPPIQKLLDQFNTSFTEGGFNKDEDTIDLSGVDDLMEKVRKSKRVIIEYRRISRCHSYYYTAFVGLYKSAKESYGTIKSTDFHWLRVVNRILFYAIDSVGMDRSRIESAGIRSHYLAEMRMNWGQGGRISRPQVDSAVLGFISELEDDQWSPVNQTQIVLDEYHPLFMRSVWCEDAPDDPDSHEDSQND